MTGEGVVAGGGGQTEDGCGEKGSQHNLIDEWCVRKPRPNKKIDREEDESQTANTMGPDVQGFGVKAKD